MSTIPAVATVTPGLHRGVPYDVYASWQAVRHSFLRHFNRTPAHAYQAMTDPEEPSEAQALGHAAHVAILEPARFEAEFAAQPYMGDRRSSKVREQEEEFRKAHPGVTFLPNAEHERCLRLREAVWGHATAAELLTGSARRNEVSALWIDPETGVTCKGRLDRITHLGDWGVICDLKSTTDAGPRAFARDIYRFGYEQQGAFYLDGLHALHPRPRKYVFIVVEKDPPYAVACYELDQDALDLGRDTYRKNLRAYKQCVETGRWPGYDAGLGTISVPTWAFRFHGEMA